MKRRRVIPEGLISISIFTSGANLSISFCFFWFVCVQSFQKLVARLEKHVAPVDSAHNFHNLTAARAAIGAKCDPIGFDGNDTPVE